MEKEKHTCTYGEVTLNKEKAGDDTYIIEIDVPFDNVRVGFTSLEDAQACFELMKKATCII